MFGSVLAAHCQIFSSCAHSSGFVFIALVGPSPAIPSLSLKTLSLKVFFVKVLSLMLPPLSRFCAKETPYLSLSKSFKVSQSPPMSQESRVGRNSIKRTENDKCVCVYEKSHWCIALFILIKSFCRISSFFSYISIKPWFHTTRTSTEQDSIFSSNPSSLNLFCVQVASLTTVLRTRLCLEKRSSCVFHRNCLRAQNYPNRGWSIILKKCLI